MRNTSFFKSDTVEEHIADIIVDYLNNSCPHCQKYDALSFFDQHPDDPKTCYACKCSQVSMVTMNQGIRKFPSLKESTFNKLRKERKSVKIREWQGYRENEYFSVPDLIKQLQNMSYTKPNKSRKRTLSTQHQNQGQPQRKRQRRK